MRAGSAVTVLAGGFSFKSGKMPSSSYQVETAYGEVNFHGTCTYGSAEGFFVLRCSDLVTVTYKDGQVQQLAEGQGVSLRQWPPDLLRPMLPAMPTWTR